MAIAPLRRPALFRKAVVCPQCFYLKTQSSKRPFSKIWASNYDQTEAVRKLDKQQNGVTREKSMMAILEERGLVKAVAGLGTRV
jgi:hypothetical protein